MHACDVQLICSRHVMCSRPKLLGAADIHAFMYLLEHPADPHCTFSSLCTHVACVDCIPSNHVDMFTLAQHVLNVCMCASVRRPT